MFSSPFCPNCVPVVHDVYFPHEHDMLAYRQAGAEPTYKRIAYIRGRIPIARQRIGANGCAKGEVRRAAYTKKDGTYVPSRCQKGKGLSRFEGQATRTGIVGYKMKHAGILRNNGYSQKAPLSVRRNAIHKAVKMWKAGGTPRENALGLFRHMNLILTRSRNRATNLEGLRNFAADVDWIKTHYHIGKTSPRAKKLINRAIVRARSHSGPHKTRTPTRRAHSF
jgi:hypothetical protein